MICHPTLKIASAIVCSLSLLTIHANAQESSKACTSVEVRSIDVSYKFVKNIPLDAQQETIETALSAAERKAITVVARGPVLGSMDSSKITTELSCTSTGVTFTATISRSEYYGGVVAKNVLWQPKITIAAALRSSEVLFQVLWKIRLTNGKEVGRARTPPYPEQTYPLIVTKTVHSADGQKP